MTEGARGLWTSAPALLGLLVSCAAPSPPVPPGPCTVVTTVAPGPRQADRAANVADPLFVADIFIDEARRSGDDGFYTLAEGAVECALLAHPDDPEARRTRLHLWEQDHRFEDVAREAQALVDSHGDWRDYAQLGDARMEQGRLEEAAAAYQAAVDRAPGYALYDRIAWLRWLRGDVEGATMLQAEAAAAAPRSDPETRAWILATLGWYHALSGQPAPELEEALLLVPDHPPALSYRARLRLHQGDREGAAQDLARAAPTFENARVRAEIDPSVDLSALCSLDPRGCAWWLADRDPERALALAEAELKVRQDATTRMVHAYTTLRSGRPEAAEAEAKEALATGIVEPRVLLHAGIVLRHRRLLERALTMGPGLLPSERVLAENTLAGLP